MKKCFSAKVIITAGGTREPIDPVRFIGNRSSGKMGIAILNSCLRKKMDVTLIHAPLSVALPKGKYKCIAVETTEQMLATVKREFTSGSILFMAAAPADFKPASMTKQKIKKEKYGKKGITLNLVPTPDILATVAKNKKGSTIVGFAAETENLLVNALKKMKLKKMDFLVANNVSRKDSGFSVDTNKVFILKKDGTKQNLPLMTKNKLGGLLLNIVLSSFS